MRFLNKKLINAALLLLFVMAAVKVNSPHAIRTLAQSAQIAQIENCESVAEKLCYQNSEYDVGPCHKNEKTSRFGDSLIEVCSQFPPILRSLLLSLDRINVGPRDKRIARADTRLIDINEKVFDPSFSLSRVMTWKEQLNFGGSVKFGEVSLAFPKISMSLPGWKHELLSFTIAHELGHVWSERVIDEDFKSSANSDESRVKRGSWSANSWKTESESGDRPKFWQRFYGIKNFNFYRDGKQSEPVSERELRRTYEGLWKSSFITSYATQNHNEDFAETFAFVILEKAVSVRYRVEVSPQQFFDLATKLDSRQFANKKSQMVMALEDTETYPHRAVGR